MRQRFVAGNWKMNLERRSAVALCAALREHVGTLAAPRLAVAPPFVYLPEVVAALPRAHHFGHR